MLATELTFSLAHVRNQNEKKVRTLIKKTHKMNVIHKMNVTYKVNVIHKMNVKKENRK